MNIRTYADPANRPLTEAEGVARLLELDGPAVVSDVDLARRVSAGLGPEAAAALAEAIGGERVIGPVVPAATLRRARESGRPLSRAHSERLYEIGRVVDALGRAYGGDRDRVERFLGKPHPLLDDETPFDMARSSSAGADAVMNLIYRANEGMPV